MRCWALGSRLPHLRGLHIVYATDGAPSDMADARRLGLRHAAQDYAARARARSGSGAGAARRRSPTEFTVSGYVDQDVAYDMTALSRTLR